MSDSLAKLRNIGVMAHIDAGKTTVSERILYFSGKTYKIGEVHDGTAVMDFLEEEQERGITITSAATRCPWGDYQINLIDTPGHVDFTAEVERSLRVLDGAIAVFDASEGVQAQSETVWRQGQKYHLPCLCFLNKMDKTGADFEMSVQSIREKLAAHPVPVQYPIGQDSTFEGLIDLISMKAFFFHQEDVGSRYEEAEIPDSLKDAAEHWRHEMIEAAAEFDEQLMDAYVHNDPIDNQAVVAAIRKGTLTGRFHPLFVGAALRNMGIRKLLDGVTAFLPSPLDRPEIFGHKPDHDKKDVKIVCDPKKPFVGLAFKITGDKHGDLYFIRIYQGHLQKGSRIYNSTRDCKENITRIFEMHASSRDIIDSAQAGDIVAVIGLKETLTGDTLCDSRSPVILESISFPETVVSMSIEPKSSADRMKLSEALNTLRREDPTFNCRFDAETGQTIMCGMGELHLEILQHKITRDLGVDIRVGRPRVAYKEAITRTAGGEGKFVKQTGGRGQYGHAIIEIEPLRDENNHISMKNEFENAIIGGSIPKEYISPVERGIKMGLATGFLGGFPVFGVKARLLDGSFHAVDSSEVAFEQAGMLAVREALRAAGPVLLEPIMKVEVTVPDNYYGAVQGNLISKRGMITDTRIHTNIRVIDANVPLSEMFGYAGELRGATAGRGSFTMEPLCYEKAPEQISEKILAGYY